MRGTWQTTSSGSGGGGLVVAVIVALVLIGSGALTAIVHALAVLLIAAAVAIPVTAVSIIALAAHRTRSERPGRPDGPAWVSREPPGIAAAVGGFPQTGHRPGPRGAPAPQRVTRAPRRDRAALHRRGMTIRQMTTAIRAQLSTPTGRRRL